MHTHTATLDAPPSWLTSPTPEPPKGPTPEEMARAISRSTTGGIADKDLSFAMSLVDAALSSRGVSDKQLHWLRIFHERATAPAQAPASAAPASFAPIVTMFDAIRAKGAKAPKIRVASDAGPVCIKIAGPQSRYVGQLQVMGDGPFGDRAYYGRVDLDGVWHPSRDATPEAMTAIGRALEAFALDPAGVAGAYGHKTGSRCFCSKDLTDPRSVTVGYGPDCAARWSLPWGETPATDDRQAVLL